MSEGIAWDTMAPSLATAKPGTVIKGAIIERAMKCGKSQPKTQAMILPGTLNPNRTASSLPAVAEEERAFVDRYLTLADAALDGRTELSTSPAPMDKQSEAA